MPMCQCANVPNEKEIGTNSLNAEEKSPTFPKEIYDNLPNILSKVVSMARGEDDADLLLLGSLTTLPSCLPNIYGNYDERRDHLSGSDDTDCLKIAGNRKFQ